jgi:hypothetical protein
VGLLNLNTVYYSFKEEEKRRIDGCTQTGQVSSVGSLLLLSSSFFFLFLFFFFFLLSFFFRILIKKK